MNIVSYEIDKINEAEYNPRELSKKQHEDLYDSIRKFGLVDPILININPERKNIVIGGHQRLKICKELNFKAVPCVELNISEKEEKELNIRLNKNHGQWDFDNLANFFNADDLFDWGFDMKEIKFSVPEINELAQDMEVNFDDSGDDYMPSQVRMLQLFLDSESEPKFKEMIVLLNSIYMTKNLTETVIMAVENEYNKCKN
jgi:ParB-like chromosome segregation protein Spo0J